MFVSVITAVFNGESFLNEAIESILSQTYNNFEYIIVNDGSTDGTAQILDTIRDQRVRIIHIQKNQGAAASLNIGIEQASGDLIAIQDADDSSMPIRLEEQVKFLSEHNEFIGVGSLVNCIQGEKLVSTKHLLAEEKWANYAVGAESIYSSRFHGCSLVHGSVTYYKDVFIKAGKYDPSYRIGYDYDLWLRLFEEGKIAKIPAFLYRWRVNLHSLSRKDPKETCNEVLRASASAIVRQYRKRTDRAPLLCVCGPSNGCHNFQKNTAALLNVKIRYFSLNLSNITSLYNSFLKKEIDGVVILDDDNKKSDYLYEKLASLGMTPNENLFKIWNVHF